jgi:hypothetical protein
VWLLSLRPGEHSHHLDAEAESLNNKRRPLGPCSHFDKLAPWRRGGRDMTSISEKLRNSIESSKRIIVTATIQPSDSSEGRLTVSPMDGGPSFSVEESAVVAIEQQEETIRHEGRELRTFKLEIRSDATVLLEEYLRGVSTMHDPPCSSTQEGRFRCIHGTTHRCIRDGNRYIWWDWQTPCLTGDEGSSLKGTRTCCTCNGQTRCKNCDGWCDCSGGGPPRVVCG